MPSHTRPVATTGLSHLQRYGFYELDDGGNEHLHSHIWARGPHDGLDPKVVKARGVANAMRAALKAAEVPDISRVNEFVPLKQLGRIINETTIAQLLNELDSCRGMSSSQRKQLANEICSATPHRSYRRVVATLIRIKKEEEIPKIVREGFMDDCLPLDLADTQLHHRKTGSMCRVMSEWDEAKRRKYWKMSQKFSCPVFTRSEGKVFHYILHQPVTLPFQEEVRARKKRDSNASSSSGNGGGQDKGGYSSVARVRIHKSHHDFGDYGPRLEDDVFAVKTLHTKDENEFEKEVTVLLRFAHRKDKQVVKLLATYEIRDGDDVTYHLIFPWAECNLRSLWGQHPMVDRASASRIQLITKEVAAIAASLAYIHDEYARDLDPRDQEQFGRHGDIKAENFLVYRTRSSQHVVFVADFGLSRFHRQHSRSMVHPNATSPSYRPPEFDLPNGTLSRKSDIWSLGAFYLEHLTWFLEGWKAVETDFPDFREDEDHEHIVSDIFFKIVVQGNSRKAIIKPRVTDWIHFLHQHDGATQYIHDLLGLIETRMLVVDRESRIDASSLKVQLQDMCRRSDKSYYMRGLPWRNEKRA